jgi:hypothetical protein
VLVVLVALHREPLVLLETILYLTQLLLLAVVMVVTMVRLKQADLVDLAVVAGIKIMHRAVQEIHQPHPLRAAMAHQPHPVKVIMAVALLGF